MGIRAVGGCVVMGLLAACGGGDDTSIAPATRTDADVPATTNDGSPETAPVPEPDEVAPGAAEHPARSEDARTRAGAAENERAQTTPTSGISAPAAGRYEYGIDRDGMQPAATTLVIEDIVGEGGVVQQFHRFGFEDQRRLWVWSADSAVIDRTETASDARHGGAGYTCIWSEPPAVLRAPLSVGQRWTTSTSCRFSVDGEEIRHDASEEREVVGRQLETVGDQEVEVVAIERRTVLVASGSRPFTQRVTSLDEFAPSVGLLVRSDTVAVIEQPDGSRRGTGFRLQLVGSAPEG